MYETLFQPIAGDSTRDHDAQGKWPLIQILGLQFGILDVHTIRALSVVMITNSGTSQVPGSLGDLRMGLNNPVAGQFCETCHHNHHNCPGQRRK